MDIYWYGQAMFKIKGKTATLIIDPFNPQFTGLKFPKEASAEIVLSTHNHEDHNYLAGVSGNPLIINGPGEYEVLQVNVTGLPACHDSNGGTDKGKITIYHILMDGINLVHLGDLGENLSENQLNQISQTDILMIPVGGHATISFKAAARIITELEPAIVLPMHYSLPGLKFELDPVEPFLKEMGADGDVQPQTKLTINKDKLPEETTVILLNKN